MVGRTPELDRPSKRLAYLVEAALAYPVFTIIGWLPIRLASNIGGWLGRTIGYRSGLTKRARQNLIRALPDLSTDAVEDILKSMWDNVGRTLFEFPNLEKLNMDGPDPDVIVEGADIVARLKDSDQASIFVGGHFANWEVAAHTVWHLGIPLQLIYRAPNNPLVDKLFKKRLKQPDAVIPKGNEGARHAVRALKNKGQLGMLIDQKMNDGIAVPFLGMPAMTAPALAIFALKFKCPVVAARVERLDGPTFRVRFFKPTTFEPTGDKETDILNLMTAVNDQLGDWVKDNPAQWLWLHNRWPKN